MFVLESTHSLSENSILPRTVERYALRVGKIRDVASIVKLAPSTIRAKMRAGDFPASIRLSYKLAVWNLDEVESWFLEKLNTSPVYVPHVRMANHHAPVAASTRSMQPRCGR